MSSEPSPPIEMIASMPSCFAFSISSSERSSSMIAAVGAACADSGTGCRGSSCGGSCRPGARCRAPSPCVSGTTSSSPSRPAKPRLMPSTSQPRLMAESTAARMTALSPGASPPPVEIAMRIAVMNVRREARRRMHSGPTRQCKTHRPRARHRTRELSRWREAVVTPRPAARADRSWTSRRPARRPSLLRTGRPSFASARPRHPGTPRLSSAARLAARGS